jgi:hypothetical protein
MTKEWYPKNVTKGVCDEYIERITVMEDALKAIRDYEPHAEVAYDEFAYKRLMQAYRNAAIAAMEVKP